MMTKLLGKQLVKHWIIKGKFAQDQVRFVDWEAVRDAEKSKPIHHQR